MLDTISRLLDWGRSRFGDSPRATPRKSAAPPPPPASLATQDHVAISAAPRLQPMTVLLAEQQARLVSAAPTPGVQSGPGASAATVNALASVPGAAWAGRLAGNGEREAAILMPEGFDPARPAEVVFYFHGHDGSIAESLTKSRTGMAGTIQALASQRNLIVVIPQGPAKARDYTWMNAKNGESLSRFQQAAFARIEQLAPGTAIGQVSLKGHSAGGLPLLNASGEPGLRADRIDFLDASYGHWASETWRKLQVRGQAPAMNVVYIAGTGTQADANRIKGKPGVRLISTAAKVNHGLVPKTHFAD